LHRRRDALPVRNHTCPQPYTGKARQGPRQPSDLNMNLDALEASREQASKQKQEESAAERGADLLVVLQLPGGPDGPQQAEHRLPAGVTVAYLKLVIEQQHGIPSSTQCLKLAGKPMLDPFSLCDYPALKAGQAPVSITVELLS